MSSPDSEPHIQTVSAEPRRSEVDPALGLRAAPQSRVLDAMLLLVCALPALAIALPVAVINGLQFRSIRKIFFTQERMGLGGTTFVLWKFRTLRDGVDEQGRPLTDRERVTRFGRVLRNTHLDELPQMFNVLRGDMAFIGPRPEMVSLHKWACNMLPGFESRLILRPGITGLAQVTQGYANQGVKAYAQKLSIDQDYIMRRSFAFDLHILAMTGVWMLRGKGWQWKDQQGEDLHKTVLRALPPEFREQHADAPEERKAA